jgi:hypothetical protein
VFPEEAVDAALASTGIDGKRRAETLSIEEHAAMARAIPAARVAEPRDPLDLVTPEEFEDG